MKNKYAELGLTEEEICGAIINTALGNTKTGYSMAKILPNAKMILELSKEDIDTVVSEKHIQKAIQKRKKAFGTMKKTVNIMKKNNDIGEIEKIGRKIDALCAEKKSQKVQL